MGVWGASLLIFFVLFSSSVYGEGGRPVPAGAAQGLAGAGAGIASAMMGMHAAQAAQAQAQGDQAKAAEEMAKMMMEAAQMAAMLAAMAANKKAKEKAQQNDPVKPPPIASASPSPTPKDTPAMQIPESSPAQEVELAEETKPAPPPIPEAVAPQIAEAPDEEVPAAAPVVELASNVPDSIPARTKLGYDENGDGTKPSPGRNDFPSLAKGDERLFIPLEQKPGGRGAKGGNSNSDSSEGVSEGASAMVAEAPAPPNLQGMIDNLLKPLPKQGGAPANQPLTAEEFAAAKARVPEKARAQIADVGSKNIFEFASERYRQMQQIDIVRITSKTKRLYSALSRVSPSGWTMPQAAHAP